MTASLIIRKLASYPRQNSLHTALREVGRIERSLFMLEWMKDPELRRRVQVGLNKGEARNALARAVFFNRQGDLRDRSFENQRYRASGLNLIVAAIILWNTVYLERAIAALRGHGVAMTTKLLSTSHPSDGSTSIDRRLHLAGFRTCSERLIQAAAALCRLKRVIDFLNVRFLTFGVATPFRSGNESSKLGLYLCFTRRYLCALSCFYCSEYRYQS